MEFEIKQLVESMREPSGECQACCSDHSPDKDFIMTCEVCQGSIHNKHYGRQFQEVQLTDIEKWQCERCRVIVTNSKKNKLQKKINCELCPQMRGIMKRVSFKGQIIWAHPECTTWCFPIVYQKNQKRLNYIPEYPTKPTGSFWVNLQKQATSLCQVCGNATGYKSKCMYYTCEKYYHATCARSVGFVRNLDSMKFQGNETYIPPYCEEHLELRVIDCQRKSNEYEKRNNFERASQFTKMKESYDRQLRQLRFAVQKQKDDQLIRLQLQHATRDISQDIEFSQQASFESAHSSQFYDFLGEFQ